MILPALALLLAPHAAQAQSAGAGAGGGSASPAVGSQGSAQTSTIQPATGSGQVGQAPQNSAMRGAASGQARQPTAARVNPMGMAGMGSSGSATNALTLGGMQGQGQSAGMGQGGQGQNGQGSVTITDTGVTQRTPSGQGGRR